MLVCSGVPLVHLWKLALKNRNITAASIIKKQRHATNVKSPKYCHCSIKYWTCFMRVFLFVSRFAYFLLLKTCRTRPIKGIRQYSDLTRTFSNLCIPHSCIWLPGFFDRWIHLSFSKPFFFAPRYKKATVNREKHNIPFQTGFDIHLWIVIEELIWSAI